jgi:hypothetical protein
MFLEAFLSNVVDNDSNYYDPIQRLLADAGVSLDRVVLTDLCRASFVAIDGDRSGAGESILRANDELFNQYVQANTGWHNERIGAFGGNVIIALGALATRGVHHLLHGQSGHRWVRSATTPALAKVAWQGRTIHILRVPHPAAYGQAPHDGTDALLALMAGKPIPATQVGPRPLAKATTPLPVTFTPSDSSPLALWKLALRPAKPLPASVLMAEHPKAQEKTRQLLEDGLTPARIVAITNAMYNPCRPANMRKKGLPVTSEQAWTLLFERKNHPHSNQKSKWRPLVHALEPIPESVRVLIQRMTITDLGSLAAAVVRGPYALMEAE